jgi:hypothetical protein
MSKLSHSDFRQRIENHLDDYDLDVVVRKRKRDYALYWADDREPLARLRPTGEEDEVEVYWWDDERWAPVGEFGLAMPLDEALQFITEDSQGLFFGSDCQASDESDSPASSVLGSSAEVAHGSKVLALWILVCTAVGAAVGGMFTQLGGALIGAAATGMLVGLTPFLLAGSLPGLRMAFAFGCVLASLACVGGITGSAVHAALGTGFWPGLGGCTVGVLCSVLLLVGGLVTWLVGLVAGLNLAAYLVGLWQWRDHFVGLALVAVLAAGGASLCHWAVTAFTDVVNDLLEDTRRREL